ncbi:prepilin-type N-terminal cleavage/methylation domain-containing protein [Thalassococcus sp. BH17M4-6]|uniref:prepilin-type N-terminal cleavage/methylation domain-containing protein n=1 Tax=Thalassococcus sp. BH17M4-6 TaxID=3413148 RepID=UPI003BF52A3C
MPQNPRDGEAGVTLLETLIVLVVIGVLAGGAALSLRATGDARDARQEAALLAARLDIAVEHALIAGTPARLDWDGAGYVFESWDGSDWHSHTAAPLGQRHDLQGGLRLIAADGTPRGVVPLRSDGLPAGDGPLVLRIATGDEQVDLRFDGLSAQMEDRP